MVWEALSKLWGTHKVLGSVCSCTAQAPRRCGTTAARRAGSAWGHAPAGHCVEATSAATCGVRITRRTGLALSLKAAFEGLRLLKSPQQQALPTGSLQKWGVALSTDATH